MQIAPREKMAARRARVDARHKNRRSVASITEGVTRITDSPPSTGRRVTYMRNFDTTMKFHSVRFINSARLFIYSLYGGGGVIAALTDVETSPTENTRLGGYAGFYGEISILRYKDWTRISLGSALFALHRIYRTSCVRHDRRDSDYVIRANSRRVGETRR